MKTLLAVTAALLCGAASAQDAGTMCRSFCDADARQCREPVRSAGWVAADALIHLQGSWSPAPDKREQAAGEADQDRRAHAQQCGDARQACRQKCSTPAAASAPDAAVSAAH